MKTLLISIVLIIVLAIFFTVGITYLVKLAKKKNIKVDSILEDTAAALNTAETVATAISPLFPQYAPLLKTILYVVSGAVGRAESLFKAAEGDVTLDRKSVAVADITAALKKLGIPVDTDMIKFIDAAVEMAVRALPKTTPVVETAEVAAPATDTVATAAA